MVTTLSNSIRKTPITNILKHESVLRKRAGITRITDITFLDRIGVPVYISVRPKGKILCVNSGKGTTKEEAKAGALMEGVEFSVAEKQNNSLENQRMSLYTYEKNWKSCILDFCPPIGQSVNMNKVINWTIGRDVFTGEQYPIPSELVYVNPDIERTFGSDTNGLASGYDKEEALLHSICEVAERDIKSIQIVNGNFVAISNKSLFGELRAQYENLKEAGISLHLRFFFNQLELPCFQALIWDPQVPSSKYLNTGFGCHPLAIIAASRAVTEAIQSRLLYIHGGRDDLAYVSSRANSQIDDEHYVDFIKKTKAFAKERVIEFAAVDSLYNAPTKVSVPSLLEYVLERFYNSGFQRVIMFDLSDETLPVSVIKTVVPGAENFTPQLKKSGKRLIQHYGK